MRVASIELNCVHALYTFWNTNLIPASLITKPPTEPKTTSIPFVANLQEAMRDAHDSVMKATKSKARTQHKYYDDWSRCTKFWERQVVWLYWPKPTVCQKFQKLSKLCTGPWRIIRFKSPLVVELRHVKIFIPHCPRRQITSQARRENFVRERANYGTSGMKSRCQRHVAKMPLHSEGGEWGGDRPIPLPNMA